MTDRELLELAAKAAGVHAIEWAKLGELLPNKDGFVQFFGYGQAALWNPLTDDGDAFRLMAQLRIDFCIDPDETRACAWSVPAGDFMEEPLTPDPYAAARRAIVRAAAELGKATP